MRDIKRISHVLELLKQIWERTPDQRFGQMLVNLGIAHDNMHTWTLEDSDLIDALISIIKDMEVKNGSK